MKNKISIFVTIFVALSLIARIENFAYGSEIISSGIESYGLRSNIYDKLTDTIFAPNDSMTYVVEKNGKKLIIRDGKEIGGEPRFGIEEAYLPVYSDDGQGFAYIAESDGRKFIVINDEKILIQRFEGRYDSVRQVILSPQGNQHALLIKMLNGKYIANIGGWETEEYDSINLFNNPIVKGEGIGFQFLGEKSGQKYLIYAGLGSMKYDPVEYGESKLDLPNWKKTSSQIGNNITSSDGKSTAILMKNEQILKDGKDISNNKTGDYLSRVTYLGDNSLVFSRLLANNEAYEIVHESKKGTRRYSYIEGISPVGKQDFIVAGKNMQGDFVIDTFLYGNIGTLITDTQITKIELISKKLKELSKGNPKREKALYNKLFQIIDPMIVDGKKPDLLLIYEGLWRVYQVKFGK